MTEYTNIHPCNNECNTLSVSKPKLRKILTLQDYVMCYSDSSSRVNYLKGCRQGRTTKQISESVSGAGITKIYLLSHCDLLNISSDRRLKKESQDSASLSDSLPTSLRWFALILSTPPRQCPDSHCYGNKNLNLYPRIITQFSLTSNLTHSCRHGQAWPATSEIQREQSQRGHPYGGVSPAVLANENKIHP